MFRRTKDFDFTQALFEYFKGRRRLVVNFIASFLPALYS